MDIDARAKERALNSLLDGVYIYDFVEGHNVYINSRYTELTGYTLRDLDALSGPEFMGLFHPDDAAAVIDHMKAVGESTGDEVFEIEYRFKTADGTWIWCRSRDCVLERQADGTIRYLIGYFSDISDRKRAELEVARDHRRKDEFLATLSHELRNPLAPIRTGVEILKLESAPEATRQKALGIIEHQVDHLVRLVDDLMQVSRITRGKVELVRSELEVRQMVSTAVESVLAQAEHRHRKFELSFPTDPVRIHADRVRLEQVLFNLLHNAVKYSPSDSVVRVDVAFVGDELTVSIRDEGVGIAADELEEIFHLFHQENGHANGLGVGLSLARSLAELHGGSVTAKSSGRGQGSEFTLTLPRTAHAAGPSPAKPRAASVLDGRRILVVDDNRDAADGLGMLLEGHGALVEVAYDGRSALDRMAGFQPELVLLDIGMPGMDGYEVARRMRERPEGGAISLIAVTGWGQEQDVARSKDAGFDAHLTKPAPIAAILRAVADRLQGA